MRAISQARFEAMAAYCRMPLAQFIMQELAWFEIENGQILATLVRDTDEQYSGIILARDLKQRFRCIGVTRFLDRAEQAVIELHLATRDLLARLDAEREQGDEAGKPVDFFTPVVREGKLGRGFLTVTSGSGFSPAREIIGEMMRWHEDVDGNFIEQFQTTGFDARIWELYLFAALTESGLDVTQPSPAPDFLCVGQLGEFALEATTVNPSIGRDGKPLVVTRPETDEEHDQYAQHYLPIKYAGPLTAKLRREYWKKPSVEGRPLVFAIQDFHDVMSMSHSGSALGTYLYGYVHASDMDADGSLVITSEKIHEHKWENKVVPSAFFSLPSAENVSAVVFNASATLSKFNRMGVAAGFGNGEVVLIREGRAYDPDPNAATPAKYLHVVSEGYPESWIEGMTVFHNPNALQPLNPDFLPGAVHHHLLKDGRVRSDIPGWAPLNSVTSVIALTEAE